MTRYAPQWLQTGSYSAAQDRRLIGALWPSPAVTGMAVAAAGTGMDVTVDPGQAAVPSANNTGTVLCSSDAVETLASGAGGIDPAPPTGTDRVDLIVVQPRSADLGGTTEEDFIFAVIKGAEGAPPGVAPGVPAGTLALAQVHVAGGAASITATDITDQRSGQLAVPPMWVPPAYPPKPPVLVGNQDHARGSLSVGTSDGGVRALPAVQVPSTLLIILGGNHGYGAGASSASYTLKRQTPATNLIGSGTINVPAAMTHALPTFFWSGDINPGDVWNLFITVTVAGSNNYFSPKVGYIITPK